MIRTTFSLLTLCASLYLAGWLIHQSTAAEPAKSHISGLHRTATDTPATGFMAPEQVDTRVEQPVNGNGEQPVEALIDLPQVLKAQEAQFTVRVDDSEPFELDLVPANTGKQDASQPQESSIVAPAAEKATTAADPDSRPNTATSEAGREPLPENTRHLHDAETTIVQDPASGRADKVAPIPENAVPLSPELVRLREDIRDCLGYYYNQFDSIVDHSPWGIMHVLIAYGVDTQVIANNQRVNAIGWLCWNGSCRGQQLFYMANGKLQARLGPGVQGHAGQFLAMMAQSRLKSAYPMRVDGHELTLDDLIEHEKLTCVAGTELTFKLIGLSHYLDSDAEWRSQTGERWNIQRLIKEELAQPIVGAACGGTHRLMGFNYAVRKREKEGRPIDGQWKRAQIYLADYFDYTFYLQNEDGSFSTDFFRGRNSYGDNSRRLETTGHILEWFVASLSDEQLRDPRVIKSVRYLTNLMLMNRQVEWEIGPRGHALHALAIYAERVFHDKPGSRDAILARGRINGMQHHQR